MCIRDRLSYAFTVSPWGQKSDRIGKSNPFSDAHLALDGMVSQVMTTKLASRSVNVAMSSRILHSSPSQLPVNGNGMNTSSVFFPLKSESDISLLSTLRSVNSGAEVPTESMRLELLVGE